MSAVLLLSCPVLVNDADAVQPNPQQDLLAAPTATYHVHPISVHLALGTIHKSNRATQGATQIASRLGGISCVPYARQISGIRVVGNAWQWWINAKGSYARGDQPEAGSVLNFRPNGRMQLGHVAVVTRIVNPREVIVDHANWANGGRITHNVSVVDVSEANNWSAVRVELGRTGEFGSVYPTYGFIYNRPDTGVVLTSIAKPAPQPDINPVPSDLRPVAERPWHVVVEEVAESPGTPPHRIDIEASPVASLP